MSRKVLLSNRFSSPCKTQAFYVEACESGSMFEGLLPEGLNIYASTAANAVENSYGTYCPDDYHYVPLEYDTCLGDLYSVSWMEDRYGILLYPAISFNMSLFIWLPIFGC